MDKVINGKAFVLGNNIDTDQIIPAEHLVYSLEAPEEKKFYGRFTLSGVPLTESGLPKGEKRFVEEDVIAEWKDEIQKLLDKIDVIDTKMRDRRDLFIDNHLKFKVIDP